MRLFQRFCLSGNRGAEKPFKSINELADKQFGGGAFKRVFFAGMIAHGDGTQSYCDIHTLPVGRFIKVRQRGAKQFAGQHATFSTSTVTSDFT